MKKRANARIVTIHVKSVQDLSKPNAFYVRPLLIEYLTKQPINVIVFSMSFMTKEKLIVKVISYNSF